MKSPAGPGPDLIGAWPQPASSQSCPPGPTGDDPRPPEEEEKVMTSLPADPPGVIVGVDTHQDVHVAVALDALGRRLGELQIAATTSGYGQLVRWVRELGPAARFGVEGTGSYGAGLHRYLRRHGLAVVEVNRPDRSTRHRRGKSDPIDAEAAARAVLAGPATGIPKAGDDQVEMVRLLKLTRDSAVKSRTQAINQIKGVLVTAPAELREALTGLSGTAQLDRCAGAARPDRHWPGRRRRPAHRSRGQPGAGPGSPPPGGWRRPRAAADTFCAQLVQLQRARPQMASGGCLRNPALAMVKRGYRAAARRSWPSAHRSAGERCAVPSTARRRPADRRLGRVHPDVYACGPGADDLTVRWRAALAYTGNRGALGYVSGLAAHGVTPAWSCTAGRPSTPTMPTSYGAMGWPCCRSSVASSTSGSCVRRSAAGPS